MALRKTNTQKGGLPSKKVVGRGGGGIPALEETAILQGLQKTVEFLWWQKNKLYIWILNYLCMGLNNLISWFERNIWIKQYLKPCSYLIIRPCFHTFLSDLVRMIDIYQNQSSFFLWVTSSYKTQWKRLLWIAV